VDKKFAPPLKIEKSDKRKPAPLRARWLSTLRKRKIDYRPKLHLIEHPVLICAGAKDPQTPVVMNQRLDMNLENDLRVLNECYRQSRIS